MFLSTLYQKPVFTGNTQRGICLGVGISLKTFAVKYFLCSTEVSPNAHNAYADFTASVSTLQAIENDAVRLSRMRPAFPKNCAKLFLDLPVYCENGNFYGLLRDVEMQDLCVSRLITDKGFSFPAHMLCAVSDALILKKPQPYPIGQRIPAPASYEIFNKNELVVTRSTLRGAIEKQSLIRLTLSLPPFAYPTDKIG